MNAVKILCAVILLSTGAVASVAGQLDNRPEDMDAEGGSRSSGLHCIQVDTPTAKYPLSVTALKAW